MLSLGTYHSGYDLSDLNTYSGYRGIELCHSTCFRSNYFTYEIEMHAVNVRNS